MLTGKLAALNRFISRSFDHLRPLFLALKGAKDKGWGFKCDCALEGIKSYFSSPLVLSQLVSREELFLYLAASQIVASAIVVKAEENRDHKHVYCTSKMLIDSESQYISFEKIAFSLWVGMKKLRPYFQVRQITILTTYSIKATLQKPDLSGQLLKWAVKLSEYGDPLQAQDNYQGSSFG